MAQTLFDSEQSLVRIDMSEYMEKHAVARLIGAPPGYVGHEDGGQLTEAIRRKPYSVILLDEVEKAHPDVFNVLLQVLDDGRLTDSQGRTVDFKNTVVIMTSNLGSQYLSGLISAEGLEAGATGKDGSAIPHATREMVMAEERGAFRPEFLNRVDDVVLFEPLSLEHITRIVDLLITDLNQRLEDRRITVELSQQARQWAAERGYDPTYGARPLKRFLQKQLENPLAQLIVKGEVSDGQSLRFTLQDDALQLDPPLPN